LSLHGELEDGLAELGNCGGGVEEADEVVAESVGVLQKFVVWTEREIHGRARLLPSRL